MREFLHLRAIVTALLLTLASSLHAAGRLELEGGWIRAAPPNAMMLAAYGTLRNVGDGPVIFSGAQSVDFKDVSLHETVEQNGIERMRALGRVVLAPGETMVLAPGGRHLMLMQSKRPLHVGDAVEVRIITENSGSVTAKFVVREEAPPAG